MSSPIRKTNTLDRIEAFYRHGEVLTSYEQKRCKRLELAFSLFLHHRSRKVAVSKYLSLCQSDVEFEEISISQAYRDMSQSEKLFAPIHQYKKEFIRLTIVESAVKDIKAIEKKLGEKDISLKNWSDLMSLKNQVEKRLIDSTGLNLNDPDLPDFSAIKPPEYKVVIPEEVTKMIMNLSKSGVIDVSEMLKDAEEAQIIPDDTEE
jgi:hypothetical protein